MARDINSSAQCSPVGPCISAEESVHSVTLQKTDFPPDFIFGAATSAYQVEGGAFEGGKGLDIWDTFTRLPGKIADASNGDIAVDQYHLYKEDIELLANIGFDAYRFSISWSRIFPNGLGGSINQEGITHYNDLIDSLVEKGIIPFVTLYHWQHPQDLEDAIGGWLSPEIVKYFVMFAEVCFFEFGDRVKHWITLNEPALAAMMGYKYGIFAPGRCSDRAMSPVGDSATEPYIFAHNALLAHAAAVDLYNQKFKAQQGGIIGISVDSLWYEPLTSSLEDIDAAQRSLEFQISWFLDPIFFGDYPASMREMVGDRLPKFGPSEIALVKESFDFIGLNYYTARYVEHATLGETSNFPFSGYNKDTHTKNHYEKNGEPIGDKGASIWLYIAPWGLGKLLNWTAKRYHNPLIYVTENGVDDENSPTQLVKDFLHDTERVHFYQNHLSSVAGALRSW
eukprot:c15718_g1_i3 orf=465-1820(-)